MKLRCPVCQKEDIRPTRAEGFWDKNVFSLILLRPYRCRMCWSRFYRFSLQNGANHVKRVEKTKTRKQQFNQFFNAPDDKEFQGLIGQIREAEKQIFGETVDPVDPTDRQR